MNKPWNMTNLGTGHEYHIIHRTAGYGTKVMYRNRKLQIAIVEVLTYRV